MVAGAVDMVAALGWRRLAARIAAEAGIGKKRICSIPCRE
jgi:hypothetical protein